MKKVLHRLKRGSQKFAILVYDLLLMKRLGQDFEANRYHKFTILSDKLAKFTAYRAKVT